MRSSLILFLYFYPPGLTGISTQRPPTPRDVESGEGSTPAKQDHHVTDRPSTLGLMIRPAARIIRELPPSSWLSDDGCCGCDPHRASGLRLRSVLCAQGTPEASTDRLHTCQPSSLNHGCIPCRGFLPSGPTCGPLLSCGVRQTEKYRRKKAVRKDPG
jgi:hypothetical protein